MVVVVVVLFVVDFGLVCINEYYWSYLLVLICVIEEIIRFDV